MNKIKSDVKLFIVESPGFTGTTWLTQTLNTIECIFSIHGVEIRTKEQIGREEGRKIEIDKTKDLKNKQKYLNMLRINVDQYVEKLLECAKKYPNVNVVGSVHGLKIALAEKCKYEFKYFHLFRHPINHVNSWMRQSGSDFKSEPVNGPPMIKEEVARLMKNKAPGFIDDVEKELGIKIYDIEDKSLIILYHLAALVPSWVMFRDKIEVSYINFEEMTENVDYLVNVIEMLSEDATGTLRRNLELKLQEKMATKVNFGSLSRDSEIRGEIWTSWSDVSRLVYVRFFEKFPTLTNIYRNAHFDPVTP